MTKESILLIHSIIGILVFITGLLQIILKKGGNIHRIIGQIYLYAWLFLLISGAYLGGLLITIIGIFGFYFTLTGSRIGRLKGNEMTLFDKAIFILGLLIGTIMLFYAIKLFLKGDQSFAIIFTVFGGLFLMQSIQDLYKYILNKPLKKQIYGKLDWYFEHFTRMYISFIASITAFTSIQNLFKNNTLNFLMPTVVGFIAIILVTKSYKKKFGLGN